MWCVIKSAGLAINFSFLLKYNKHWRIQWLSLILQILNSFILLSFRQFGCYVQEHEKQHSVTLNRLPNVWLMSLSMPKRWDYRKLSYLTNIIIPTNFHLSVLSNTGITDWLLFRFRFRTKLKFFINPGRRFINKLRPWKVLKHSNYEMWTIICVNYLCITFQSSIKIP